MNMIVTDILRKYSFYPESGGESSEEEQHYSELKIIKDAPVKLEEPNVDWFNSSFIRLQTVDVPEPIIKGKINFDKPFYENEDILTTF